MAVHGGSIKILMRAAGFIDLWKNGITLTRSVSFSFLYIIVGLHALHIVAGVIALLIISVKAFSVKRKTYSSLSIDLMSIYWHFVDFLWIYLFIFLLIIR